MNVLGGPAADGVAAAEEHLQEPDDRRLVDFDAGMTHCADGDGQGQALQEREVHVDVQAVALPQLFAPPRPSWRILYRLRTPDWDWEYEMARAIAKGKARGPLRDDVVSNAYYAVAMGAKSWHLIHNEVCRSLRDEWRREKRYSSLEIADSLERGQEPPERARPDVWEALGVLTPRRRDAVVSVYWEGYTQGEVAEYLGISQQRVNQILMGAIQAMKVFFEGTRVKRGGGMPYPSEENSGIS